MTEIPISEDTTETQSADTPRWVGEMEARRMVEALLFAAEEPMSEADLAARLGPKVPVGDCLAALQADYRDRGINLVQVGGRWQFRTASDLAHLMRREVQETRKLSRAGVETLAIIAYHQPVTRAEIEDIRGVSISKGTLDVLLEAGWVKPRGRRKTPGRPLQYGTTEGFLVHFGLEGIEDLPGLADLKAAGLLESVDEAMDRLDDDADRTEEGDGDDTRQMDLEEALRAQTDEAEQEGQDKDQAEAGDRDPGEPAEDKA